MTYIPFLPLAVMLGSITAFALANDPKLHWRFRSRRAAEKRAVALLREWMTPEQLKQWDTREDFDVIGCDTGTRYRITCGTTMNIHQLDGEHRPVNRWCFAPVGKLAVADVLLAQKVALENSERSTLALANSQSLCYPRVS
jgi:hypothetical protein